MYDRETRQIRHEVKRGESTRGQREWGSPAKTAPNIDLLDFLSPRIIREILGVNRALDATS